MRWSIVGALALGFLAGCAVSDDPSASEQGASLGPQASLVDLSILPAETYADGPPSGARLDPKAAHGITVPFARQPVQGVSALVDNHDGTFLAMLDNGYGALENSADFQLRVYTIRPLGNGGGINVLGHVTLSDPDHRIAWPITNAFTADRILTGADLDIESMQRAPDGTLWFGDEFGPFIVHTDGTGRLLEAPIPIPDPEKGGELRSPQSPLNEEGTVVRIMNALAAHGAARGATKRPVLSPDHALLVDGKPSGVPSRDAPPVGSGLAAASSKIIDVKSVHNAGYAVVPYTVNTLERMLELMALGVDGLISDRPDLLRQALEQYDADKDGKPDYLDADGLVDTAKFDAQGHRGARNLRPENTLPAFEAALDNLVSTLELDVGITKDGQPVIGHDPIIAAQKCRRADGTPYAAPNEVKVRDLTLAEVQTQFVCDKLFRGETQLNDSALSPVATSFATNQGMPSAYVKPTLASLFAFVDAYVAYYETGAGAGHVDAAKRVKNARRVRFNIETKVNPRAQYAARTIEAEPVADIVIGVIAKAKMEARSDLQSFDFRTLLRAHDTTPSLRTVALMGDFPVFADPTVAGTDDGTNLQGENGKPSPWLAGLVWPYRVTAKDHPFRVRASGGLESLAISPDGKRLYPLLEKPLADAEGSLLALEFDIATRTFTSKSWTYPLDARGKAVADFVLEDDTHGLVIERDDTQGDLTGLKQVVRVTLGASGTAMTKEVVVDLLHIADPKNLSSKMSPDDVGVGGGMYGMPFVTIESVLSLGNGRIAVMNDNNLPFSMGRHVKAGRSDDSEFVILQVGAPTTSR